MNDINVAQLNVDGETQLNFSEPNLQAEDGQSLNFELRVSFMAEVTDQEQLNLTISIVSVEDEGSSELIAGDVGRPNSPIANHENTIHVQATEFNLIESSAFHSPEEPFAIIAEVIDALENRDTNRGFSLTLLQGDGILSAPEGLVLPSSAPLAQWNSLIYSEKGQTTIRLSTGDALVYVDIPIFFTDRLGYFGFEGASGTNTTFPPDDTIEGLEISDISRSAGLTAASASGAFNSSAWPVNEAPADQYYEIIMTAEEGLNFHLFSLKIDEQRSDTGPRNFIIKTSLDNFSQPIDGIKETSLVFKTHEFNVGGTFENLETLTIRIYGYNATAGTGTWRIDNIRFYGEIEDLRPPEFNDSYPQKFISYNDGFELIFNSNKAATLFYGIYAENSDSPDMNTILDGANGDFITYGQLEILQRNEDVHYRIQGLEAATNYDAYFVLQDAYANNSEVYAISNLASSDQDALAILSTEFEAPLTISSLTVTEAQALEIMEWQLVDGGGNDQSFTALSQITFEPGTSNTTNWTNTLAGALLKNEAGNTIATGEISNQSIVFQFDSAALHIAHGNQIAIKLAIWLGEGQLQQDDVFQFELTGIETFDFGTQAANPLPVISSHELGVEIVGTQLAFATEPSTITPGEDFSVSVHITDIYGNIAATESVEISLALHLGDGNLSSVSGLSQNAQSGLAAWTDLRYSTSGYLQLIAEADGFASAFSTTITAGAVTDMVVAGHQLISGNLMVPGNLHIPSGSVLELTEGAQLQVMGNIICDGELISSVAILELNGSAIQNITGSGSIQLYNWHINNTMAINNEGQIVLKGRLTMSDNSLLNTNGSTSQGTLTLWADESHQGSIGVLSQENMITGNVSLQKYIPHGPAGWRLLSTPIKNQQIQYWTDYIRIQGLSGSFPNAAPQAFFYSEPKGTNGANGADGWEPIRQSEFELSGKGINMYLYNSHFKDGGIKLENTGEIHQGSVQVDLSTTASAFAGGGWNLVSNPYPSAIDWDSEAIVKTNINDALYIYNATEGSYATYINGLSTNGGSQHIAIGQSFFVKALPSGGSLTFQENSKSTASVNIRRESQHNPVTLSLWHNGKKTDESVLSINDAASESFDMDMEAIKMRGSKPEVAIRGNIGEWQSIRTVPADKTIQQFSVGFAPVLAGNYQLQMSDSPASFPYQHLKLIDHQTKRLFDPGTQAKFTVDANTGRSMRSERFEILLYNDLLCKTPELIVAENQEVQFPLHLPLHATVASVTVMLHWDSDVLSLNQIDIPEQAGFFAHSHVKDNGLEITLKAKGNVPVNLLLDTLANLRFSVNASNIDKYTQIRLNTQKSHLGLNEDIKLDISGQFGKIDLQPKRHISGMLQTPSGQSMPGAQISLEETWNVEVDSTGAFSLHPEWRETYQMRGYFTDEIRKSIDLHDLELLKKIMVKNDMDRDTYISKAADVNNDDKVDGQDLALLRDILLQKMTGNINWHIEDVSIDDISDSVKLIGIKPGDLNFSWPGVKGENTSDFMNVDYTFSKLGDDWQLEIRSTEKYDALLLHFESKGGLRFDVSEMDFEGSLLNSNLKDNRLSLLIENNGSKDAGEKTIARMMVKSDAEKMPKIEQSQVQTSWAINGENIYNVRLQWKEIDNQATSLDQISIFPNPFHDHFNVDLKKVPAQKISIRIMDTWGRIIYENDIEKFKNSNSMIQSVAAPHLPAGMYVVELRNENSTKRMKLVKHE
ncbi:MAG: T9SS type A sorting domain-containing protein [Cyclobacteriaceae bacterium]